MYWYDALSAVSDAWKAQIAAVTKIQRGWLG
jgi:hypothetical protein